MKLILETLKVKGVAVAEVVGALIWRGFGIGLFILGGSAGVGSALTGSWVNGVLVAWGTLMISVVGVVGYAIATTGKATKADVAKGAVDAIKRAQESAESKSK
jgi:hypothetical protein